MSETNVSYVSTRGEHKRPLVAGVFGAKSDLKDQTFLMPKIATLEDFDDFIKWLSIPEALTILNDTMRVESMGIHTDLHKANNGIVDPEDVVEAWNTFTAEKIRLGAIRDSIALKQREQELVVAEMVKLDSSSKDFATKFVFFKEKLEKFREELTALREQEANESKKYEDVAAKRAVTRERNKAIKEQYNVLIQKGMDNTKADYVSRFMINQTKSREEAEAMADEAIAKTPPVSAPAIAA